MNCPSCGASELKRDTRDVSYSYKGRSTLIRNVTGDYCSVCGESVTDAKESKAVMAQMIAFKRMVDASGDSDGIDLL